MKNINKLVIIYICLIIIFFIVFALTNKKEPIIIKSLRENKEYKDIKVDDITFISINKFTEGGIKSEIVSDKVDIIVLYNELMDIKYGKESLKGCDDNSTIYQIIFEDGSIKKIEIECEWIVIKDKRYLIEK